MKLLLLALEFLCSGLDCLQIRQIELEEYSLLSSFLLELFDGLFCLFLDPSRDVDLRIMCEECFCGLFSDTLIGT